MARDGSTPERAVLACTHASGVLSDLARDVLDELHCRPDRLVDEYQTFTPRAAGQRSAIRTEPVRHRTRACFDQSEVASRRRLGLPDREVGAQFGNILRAPQSDRQAEGFWPCFWPGSIRAGCTIRGTGQNNGIWL